jgi:hypothetical protein
VLSVEHLFSLLLYKKISPYSFFDVSASLTKISYKLAINDTGSSPNFFMRVKNARIRQHPKNKRRVKGSVKTILGSFVGNTFSFLDGTDAP